MGRQGDGKMGRRQRRWLEDPDGGTGLLVVAEGGRERKRNLGERQRNGGMFWCLGGELV